MTSTMGEQESRDLDDQVTSQDREQLGQRLDDAFTMSQIYGDEYRDLARQVASAEVWGDLKPVADRMAQLRTPA